MKRRSFLRSAALAGAATVVKPGAVAAGARAAQSEKPLGMKITRIRFYRNPKSPAHFNQSFHIVMVETDAGITGIGEGGSPDTAKQGAAMMSGEDAARRDSPWQMVCRANFYAPGRRTV